MSVAGRRWVLAVSGQRLTPTEWVLAAVGERPQLVQAGPDVVLHSGRHVGSTFLLEPPGCGEGRWSHTCH